MTTEPTTEPAPDHVHDLVGIGIGPFGLGLAALTDPLPDVDAVFLDRADGFAWHHGMMLDGATIQVPFLADLVSMADPTHPLSFLAWLKATNRLYPFFIREDFHPLRTEYDRYCRWAASRLDTLRWGRDVTAVEYDAATDTFVVTATVTRPDGTTGGERYRAHHVVVGIGTAPSVPAALRDLVADGTGHAVHTSAYLQHREDLREAESITVVGSGQSAAEVYRDLLEGVHEHGYRLDWITRSPRFFPMEDTKLTLEMTSPEYVDHFHALPEELRDRLGREQRSLYKGISAELVAEIHDALYRLSADAPVPTTMLTDTSVVAARSIDHTDDTGDTGDAGRYRLRLRHEQLGEEYERDTERIVLATGYAPRDPSFLALVEYLLRRDEAGRLDVARDHSADELGGRIWILNGEEHTHGLVAPDLGMGAWRNAGILNRITGREAYRVETRVAFQEFGLPADARPVTPPDTTGPAVEVVTGDGLEARRGSAAAPPGRRMATSGTGVGR